MLPRPLFRSGSRSVCFAWPGVASGRTRITWAISITFPHRWTITPEVAMHPPRSDACPLFATMDHNSVVLHNYLMNHKLAFGGITPIVCLGGPRAVVAVNDHGSSISTLADTTPRAFRELTEHSTKKSGPPREIVRAGCGEIESS